MRQYWKMISDFNKLWSGQTTSAIGNAVTRFALPTVAIFTIHATPLQIGEISALGMLPFPILGMLVGVLADRFPVGSSSLPPMPCALRPY